MDASMINSDLEYLNLQDCIIEDFEWMGKDLTLYFESFDVMPQHPDNPHDTAKCAEAPKLVFKNCKVSNAVRHDTSGIKSKSENPDHIDMKFEDLIVDFEIIEVKFQMKLDQKLVYKVIGQCAYEYNSDFAEFTIAFHSVHAKWDDLEEDSWFENFED